MQDQCLFFTSFQIEWVQLHLLMVITSLVFFSKYHYDVMDLNMFDMIQLIVVIIFMDGSVLPFLRQVETN